MKLSAPRAEAVLVAGFLLAASISGCSASGPAEAGSTTPPTATAPATTAAAAPTKLRVADLMAQAVCVGGVIGTQQYSYETGRCQFGGDEVTIAVFDTNDLRDQWIAASRTFGGNFVAGPGWAAGMNKPDAARVLANVLHGRVV